MVTTKEKHQKIKEFLLMSFQQWPKNFCSRYHAMILPKRGSTSRGLTFRLRQNIGAKTFVLI
jgi:hypothetical protein